MTRILALTVLIMIALTPFAQAEEEKTEVSSIHIESAYAFATAPKAITGAVFLTVKNEGKEEDRLLSVTSDIAEMIQIHENKIDDETGIMQMREISEVILPSGGKEILQPAGNHIMLMGLKKALLTNQKFNVTLHFEKAGEIPVPITVILPGTKPDHEKE